MNIKNKIKDYSNALKICELLIANNGEARFIGGCVRDALLNREISDIDIATNIYPEKVEQILKKAGIKYFSIGKNFGTITAVINQEKIEITTLRKDIQCDGRHAKVQFTNNWKEDAERRDFTINALSCDIEGNVYDYFYGISDLNESIVRFIGDPEQRITEDNLRILRFFRFLAYFLKNIDESGLKEVRKHIKKLQTVSGTRIRLELSKIFLAPYAVDILKLMQKENAFSYIIYCSNEAILAVERLYKIAADFNYPINEILVLSILFRYSIQKEKVMLSFNFTKSEIHRLNALISSDIQDWSEFSLRQIWQKYKNNFKEVVILNLAIANIAINCKNLLDKLFNTFIIACPIKASDIEKIGISPGKKMGELLNIAEQIWYAKEFKISKSDLLRELSIYANEL